MLTVNHIITASIMIFLFAFSPMTINLLHDSEPAVTTIAYATSE